MAFILKQTIMCFTNDDQKKRKMKFQLKKDKIHHLEKRKSRNNEKSDLLAYCRSKVHHVTTWWVSTVVFQSKTHTVCFKKCWPLHSAWLRGLSVRQEDLLTLFTAVWMSTTLPMLRRHLKKTQKFRSCGWTDALQCNAALLWTSVQHLF